MGFSDNMIMNAFTIDKDDGPYVQKGVSLARQGK